MTHFGLFDSGIGGLTVLRRVVTAFPGCEYSYVGDSARAPYGGRPYEELWQINKGIIEFLISRGVNHLIMACNTSCSQFLDVIRKEYDLPVTGIVTSIPELVDEAFKRVVVMATQATVNTHAYRSMIMAKDPSIEVIELACPTLVPIIERGEFNLDDLAEVNRALNEAIIFDPSHIVMGCTHYPFLEEIWRETCPKGVTLVNPADGIVKALSGIEIKGGEKQGKIEYYVSGNETRFQDIIESDLVLGSSPTRFWLTCAL